MTRSIVAAFALLLTAGALGLLGGGGMRASATAPLPEFRAEAMIVLTAGDTDRETRRLQKKMKAPPAAGEATAPATAKVLPQRHEYADMVEMTILILSGFAIGAGAFALGGVWGGLATASFSGLAIGAAVYAFLVSAPVSGPEMTIAAAVLIFSASALAPTLIGRAGLAAARRVGERLFAGRRADADATAQDASVASSTRRTD